MYPPLISVVAALAAHRLVNLRLLPYVEEALHGEVLAACDAHLVTLLPKAEGLIVPSKFYSIAAAGRAQRSYGSGTNRLRCRALIEEAGTIGR